MWDMVSVKYVSVVYIYVIYLYIKNMLNFVHIRKPDTHKQIIINIFKKDKYYDQKLAQNIAPINLSICWKFHKLYFDNI